MDFSPPENHARNVGQIFRPTPPTPSPPTGSTCRWAQAPPSGTVVVSGTEVIQPLGPAQGPLRHRPRLRPLRTARHRGRGRLVVGAPSTRGTPVPLSSFRDHVFGLCLLNDWSARDIQAWECVPLGPFLGKSFATSVSAWVTPLDALDDARVAPPAHTPPPPLPGRLRGRARRRLRPPCPSPSTATSSPNPPSPPCTGRPPSNWPT